MTRGYTVQSGSSFPFLSKLRRFRFYDWDEVDLYKESGQRKLSLRLPVHQIIPFPFGPRSTLFVTLMSSSLSSVLTTTTIVCRDKHGILDGIIPSRV